MPAAPEAPQHAPHLLMLHGALKSTLGLFDLCLLERFGEGRPQSSSPQQEHLPLPAAGPDEPLGPQP